MSFSSYNIYSPSWCIVPEIIEFSFYEQPVKVIKAIFEASNVCQIGRVIRWILMDIHCPVTSTLEIFIPRASHVALVNTGFSCGMLTHAKTSFCLLQSCIGIPSGITKCYASGMRQIAGFCTLNIT